MLYINGFDDIEATKYNYVCEYVICTRAPPPQRPLCCIILNQRQFEHGTSFEFHFKKVKKKKKKRTINISSSLRVPRSKRKILALSRDEISWIVVLSIPLLNLPVESEQEETRPFPMINGRGRGAVRLYVFDVWEETRKYMIIVPATALSQAAVFTHAVSSLSSLSQLTFS